MPRQPLRTGLAFLLLLAVSPAAFGQSEGVAWRTDLQAARAEAQQTGKLVLAHFWTESCGPCRKLDANVFAQPAVGMAISNEYVPVKINANQSPELAQAYGVTRVPTDAVLTPDGKLVKAFVSPATPMEYVGVVSRLAAAYRTQLGGTYNAIAAQAPSPNANPVPTRPESPTQTPPALNEAYAQLMAAGSPVPTKPQPSTEPQPTAAPPTANPYTNPAQVAQAPAPPQVRQSVPVTPEIPAKPQRPVVAATAPKLPAGSPQLGFEGYCPVTLKTENRWAAGDTKFGAIHRGRTYLFTSAEAQGQFLASPDDYSPVLSGVDPVVAVDERRSVDGSRDFGVEYPASGGRFYLFSSEESLEKFWRDPSAYAQGAERVAALPAGESFIR